MAGFIQHVLLSLSIQGYLLCSCSAWQVKLPSNIKGLKGSCLVIPCTYDYYQYPPPNPSRVVWYQYVSRGYPLVFDSWYPGSVISKFRGKTRRVEYGKVCSLEIYPLTWHHHRQRIYPWVDPENVGRSTYAFYDTTVTIEVLDSAEKPVVQIFGELTVGQEVTVHCTVEHTCPTYPPTLTLSIPARGRRLTDVSLSDGTHRTTLINRMVIEKDQELLWCFVRHTGGHTARTYVSLSAQCSFSPLTISPQSEEFLEGNAREVSCSVFYSCPQHLPTLSWNYGKVQPPTENQKISTGQWKSVSRLTFTAAAQDHGKPLTCYAKFTGGRTQEMSITLQVKRAMMSRGWSFTTPSSITGMRGSCVVIPCSFAYSTSQPPDLRVIWYLYQSQGHPSVYDNGQSTIDRFRRGTSVIGSVKERNCSLHIDRLEMLHNQDRVYPWVDKNPITSYHAFHQSFFDKTTLLVVSDHAQQPQVSIISIPRVGERSSVSCRVRNTCPFAPPTLTLDGIHGDDQTSHTPLSDGIWETTLERTWDVQEEDDSVICTVSYRGGQTATTNVKLNVECPFEEIKMDEEPGELTEGVAKSVICSVSYKCKRNTPAITWNCKDMQSTIRTTKVSKDSYTTISNLTFIGSLEDHGKFLNCTALFIHGQTTASALLHVKKYEKPIKEIVLPKDDTIHVLAADVPSRVDALTRSCVVIPCSFQEEHEPLTDLRGIWYNRDGDNVYHNGQSQVYDHFKGRTRILGDLDRQNCSLEIDDIKPFDNGPFCFRAERGNTKYRFNNSCVFIVMRASPEKPVMTPVPAEVDAGSAVNVTCSVTHTCSSHPPEFSWSVQTLTTEVKHTRTERGTWETSSTVTFEATGGDGVKNLTCTAQFWRGKMQTRTVKLSVKGTLMFQFKRSLPMAVPVALLILILATVVGVAVWRKRGRSHNSLTPPPRPEKRRSLWDRLSRRFPDDRQKPSRPEKRGAVEGRANWQKETPANRRSFWNRFSRHQGNTAAPTVSYLNNTTTANCGTQMSKPRFPSPKENRRSPKGGSTEDYNIYANF
ncbi:uncharacterized protein LOC115374422 isoform X2 [Myripristis murdjan]|uniref:uncharacterized protein LOC115374422 isoform X2 n=1 Tax=Myripristis murdjan TaxID=586833 RepID=UPI001175D2BB|nr:uncharacterized protein LOC115374422 isoform X2 [Myripristis murdjan]